MSKLDLTLEPQLLLSPQIPRQMHGVAPRIVLGPKWWRATKERCYKSTHYHCLACGVHKLKAKSRQWLEAHEEYKVDYTKGRMYYLRTVPLCHYCHNYIHMGRLLALLSQKKVPQKKFIQICQYGETVLTSNGLSIKPINIEEIPLPLSFVDWKDWRLVIGDKEYPPKYKSESHWEKAFT